MFSLLNLEKKAFIYYLSNMIVVGLIIFSVFGYKSKFQQKYPTTRLKLSGKFDYVSVNELESSFVDLLNNNLWSIDVNKIKDLAYANPWVEFVFVKKQWPDLLEVKIVQYNPIAKWNDKFFLTASGKILYSTKENNDTVNNLNLPKFYGPVGKENLLIDIYSNLLEKLTSIGLDITQVQFTENQGIQVVLGNNVILKLGTFDLLDRIARFMVAYKKKLCSIISDIYYIDLRYNNGVAVFLKPLGSSGSVDQYLERDSS